MNPRRMFYWWPGAISSLCFCCLGVAFFRYPGLQNDEVLFASIIFRRSASAYILPLGRGLPLMTMSYLGTLKSYIWGALLRYDVSEATVRLPAVLLGALTILLTFQLVERLHSRRAAIVATCILATDACFFLTVCFDWGPVAFQHFFAVTGLLLLVRFVKSGDRRSLFWAFFVFGLGLWDKAIFVWILSGWAIAAILVYPRELGQRITLRNLAVAALGISVGASPLIVYNIANPLETFRSNSHFVFNEFAGKWSIVRATLKGDALQGYLTLPDRAPGPHGPVDGLEKASFRFHSLVGGQRTGYQEQALLGALLLLPFLLFTHARRILLFLMIGFFIAWTEMAITQGAGGSVHHIILLWPLPAVFLGIAFAQMSLVPGKAGPWMLALVTFVIAGANLVALNEYLYAFIRNGAAGSWTDAIRPLEGTIEDLRASRVIVFDWGIGVPLEVMSKERIAPQYADRPTLPASAGEAEDPNAIWVGHTANNEQFQGTNARFTEGAKAAGFEKELVSTIADSHGRPVFQVFRLRRAAHVVQ